MQTYFFQEYLEDRNISFTEIIDFFPKKEWEKANEWKQLP